MARPALLAAGVTVALALPSLAAAAVLYDNPPDLTTAQDGDCVYNILCGPAVTGNTYAAQIFTIASAATVRSVSFNSIIQSAHSTTAGDPGTAVHYIFLNTTAAGDPSGAITSGTSPVTNTAGPAGAVSPTTDYTFGISDLSLDAGTYAVAFQLVTSNFYDFLSLGAAGTGAYKSDDGGSTFTPGYSGPSRARFPSVAVTISSDAVPLPAAGLMLTLGLLGLGIVRCRGRHGAA